MLMLILLTMTMTLRTFVRLVLVLLAIASYRTSNASTLPVVSVTRFRDWLKLLQSDLSSYFLILTEENILDMWILSSPLPNPYLGNCVRAFILNRYLKPNNNYVSQWYIADSAHNKCAGSTDKTFLLFCFILHSMTITFQVCAAGVFSPGL